MARRVKPPAINVKGEPVGPQRAESGRTGYGYVSVEQQRQPSTPVQAGRAGGSARPGAGQGGNSFAGSSGSGAAGGPGAPGGSTAGIFHISSPQPRSPSNAYFPPNTGGSGSGSASGSRRQSVRRSGGYGDYDEDEDRDGLNGGYWDEYELGPSPTHAYLEEFESYPSSPDPNHIPIPQSPSMDMDRPYSPGYGYEKDPNSLPPTPGQPLHGNAYANLGSAQQYGSDRYLSTTAGGAAGAGAGAGAGVARGTAASRLRGGATSGRGNKGYKEPRGCVPTNPTKRRWLFFGVPAALVVVAAVVIGVVVAVSHHSSSSSSSSSGSSSGSGSSGTKGSTSTTNPSWNTTVAATAGSGGNGSTVTTDLGATFTYVNNYGGTWAQNPNSPYNVSGQAQSWSPSILQQWVWGEHIVRGVNLGGWLVTEPFIVPALYEMYYNTSRPVDEYTLSQAMGSNLTYLMTQHYATFITEQDFADIAAAGLNYVRIPLGFWAINTQGTEPYLKGVSWTYFLKAISWARKYGIRIYLDIHALPGSQNGWNHSGKEGVVNWMYGVMGIANAQRSLEVLRTITEYISQDGVKQVVTMIGLVNEVQASVVGQQPLAEYYYQAYQLIRSITGYGAGNGPIVLLHEGFLGIAAWSGFLSGADRLGLDQHPYLAFGTQNNNPWSTQSSTICAYGGGTNSSQSSFGVIIGGEWSLAINDCGYWLDGVDSTPAYVTSGTGTSCDAWTEWFNWSTDTKAGVLDYAMSNMDALQNTFFWTWRIGNSTVLGYPASPFWHYQLGLQEGWIPKDPRVAGGYCNSIGVGGDVFNGTFPASATGAVPSPTIAASQIASYSVWPPTSLGPSFTQAQIALFPTLTRTGPIITLATPTHSANVTIGAGWYNAQDTVGAWTTVAGCYYPNEYNATATSLVPTALCTGGTTGTATGTSGTTTTHARRGGLPMVTPRSH